VVEAGRPTNQVRLGDVVLSAEARARIYAPDHPMADETGYYEGSNVNLVVEIADAREAQRSYEANLRIYEQTRQMSQGLLELLRR
jgi:flagellar basal-body rod protein FlgC